MLFRSFYLRSFIYEIEAPKNSYVYDFIQHGSTVRIAQRNHVQGGELWQSLSNISGLIISIMKMIESNYGNEDPRMKHLRNIYEKFMEKFRPIFA